MIWELRGQGQLPVLEFRVQSFSSCCAFCHGLLHFLVEGSLNIAFSYLTRTNHHSVQSSSLETLMLFKQAFKYHSTCIWLPCRAFKFLQFRSYCFLAFLRIGCGAVIFLCFIKSVLRSNGFLALASFSLSSLSVQSLKPLYNALLDSHEE